MLSSLLLTVLQTLIISTNASPFSLVTRDTAVQTEGDLKNGYDPAKQILFSAEKGPQMLDIAQGDNGDCWLDATLASLAYADSNSLKASMSDPKNSDGTVTVTLYDGATSQDYTVTKRTMFTAQTQDSNAAPAVTMGNYVWPAAMEDAFRSYADAHRDTGITLNLAGGDPKSAYKALYSDAATIVEPRIQGTADDKLWAIWNYAATKPAVTSSQVNDGNFIGGGLWLPANHAYTLVRCDQATQMVTLRNPWGYVSRNSIGGSTSGGKGVTDQGNGVFDISFQDWKTYFVWVAQVTPPTATNAIAAGLPAAFGAAAAAAASAQKSGGPVMEPETTGSQPSPSPSA